MLAKLVERLQPDLVHAMEMQRAGYLTLEARGESDALRARPWLYTCWGNDVYHFGRQAEHEPLVRRVLQSCDFFLADCQRDSRLARQYGFTGVDFGPLPGGGGFEIASMQRFNSGPPSRRKTIAVKGYQSDMWGGRALIALQALKMCADSLQGYQIVVYSAHEKKVREAAQHLSNTGARVSILSQSNHEEMVKLMGRSRLALALSTTDGTPNTMLEAMIMGAFPIQSDTVSTGEWINDGQNGFLVPPEDPEYIAEAIRRALSDDDLVDQSAEVNGVLTRAKVDASVIQPRVIMMYEQVANWKGTTSSKQGAACES
jgi:hypothetical protein